MNIGYTTGVFDLLHVGHLNLFKNAKGLCDRLIVGVTVDELMRYKNKKPVFPYEERLEIVASIRYVDEAVPHDDFSKYNDWCKYKYNTLFIGDDWHKSELWLGYEEQLQGCGVRIVYFPYTQQISSTKINNILLDITRRFS